MSLPWCVEKYQNIAISFYRNNVCENVVSDEGLEGHYLQMLPIGHGTQPKS
jgi:hypothetical protein